MWDSKSYGSEQGGFFNSPSQFTSPAEKQGKTARRVQNIVPVTVRQILESHDDGLKIGSMDIHMFSLVALVRRVEVTSTKVTYLLDDCTGGITGVFWLESTDGEEQQAIPIVVENTYCHAYGSVRTNQGKKHIFLFRIVNLSNLNDLTKHILEVMYSNLKIEKIETSEITMKSCTDSNTGLTNSFVSTSVSAQAVGFSPQQNFVYTIISKCSRDIGTHKDEVINALASKMSSKEVMKVIEFLSNEGHIYTTIDDDHFRCTDN
ncbi:replication protein A 32 kDa subunit [Zootermopsis nevadensis]|uniref:replication protein A 32 kDa subunit n=1 Tax=Zootermopsis nevadensis TaxID=136037 RepID=UPI000B8EE57C|nr:replication protein A 32 kDa subunit [Zootermopsis nevadensis]